MERRWQVHTWEGQKAGRLSRVIWFNGFTLAKLDSCRRLGSRKRELFETSRTHVQQVLGASCDALATLQKVHEQAVLLYLHHEAKHQPGQRKRPKPSARCLLWFFNGCAMTVHYQPSPTDDQAGQTELVLFRVCERLWLTSNRAQATTQPLALGLEKHFSTAADFCQRQHRLHSELGK
jgi:hypothetical protein